MVLRPRTRPLLRHAVVAVALGALFVPAAADAKTRTPAITKITPKTAYVGTKLVLTGKNFKRGKAKNSVLFKRDKGKALFVKADVSTTKRLTVVVPETLEKYMNTDGANPIPTRFRLRVLAAKLSKAYTSEKLSPTIGPDTPATDDGDGAGDDGGGDDGGGGSTTVVLDPNADCDGDGLSNGFEESVTKTLPCVADTDGDSVSDGYEYGSAVDLNNDEYRHPTESLPYPGKRPYPNPLDIGDAGTDFDGDGLALVYE